MTQRDLGETRAFPSREHVYKYARDSEHGARYR